MEDLKVVALEIIKKHGKEMAIELIDAVAVKALEEAVKKSATPVDDAILLALKEPLKAALKDLISKV